MALALLLTGCVGCAGATSARPSTNVSTSAPTAGTAQAPLFLALGDSLTTGFDGERRVDDKATAYPARVVQSLASQGRTLTLVNLACSGEDTSSLISGGRCYASPTSQLTQAESVLRVSAGQVAAVTVWIGVNDLSCLTQGRIDESCLASARRIYTTTLPTLLGRLRAAAGPTIPILVLTSFDPYRAVGESSAQAPLKKASGPAISDLNAALTRAAQQVSARLVPTQTALEGVDGKGLCENTFVCTRGDIHLTDEGQEAVAAVVLEALASRP